MGRYGFALFSTGVLVLIGGAIGWAVTVGNLWALFLFAVLLVMNAWSLVSEYAEIVAEQHKRDRLVAVEAIARHLATEQGFEWAELTTAERAVYIERAGGVK